MNLQELSNELIEFYEELLDTDIELEDSEFIPDRLNELRTIGEDLNEDNLNAFMKSSLHGMCFTLMSGNTNSIPDRGFILDDESKLGDLNDLRGQLTGFESDVAPTLFEFLVRGWYTGRLGHPLPDLDGSPHFSEGDSNAEFVISNGVEKPNMVECKKLTSFRGHWQQNLQDHFQGAVEPEGKFEDTARVLDLEDAKSHFIVNVTNYEDEKQSVEAEHSERDINKWGVANLQELEDEIREAVNLADVNQFTIVYNEVYWVDDEPRTIVQMTFKLVEDEDVVDYGGWTVLAMTGRLRNSDVANLFIYTEEKDKDWIVAHQDGYDGNFFSNKQLTIQKDKFILALFDPSKS